MRGALPATIFTTPRTRIIPAYAGSTYESVAHILCDEDHPRVCGEHVAAIVDSMGVMGSSPRMRGAQLFA